MPCFLDFISNYDLGCLVETWITNPEDFTLPGFKCFGLEAIKVHSKGRGANGIIIGVKDSLGCKVAHLKSHIKLQGSLWFHLEGLGLDLLVAVCYRPPDGSPHQVSDFLDKLTEQLSNFSLIFPEAAWIFLGDFNIRIGDLCESWHLNNHVSNGLGYLDLPNRHSQDKFINQPLAGEFLRLIDSFQGMILNGRLQDPHGEYTFITHSGASVIDFVIVEGSLWNSIHKFCVKDIGMEFSDHASLELIIQTPITDMLPQVADNESHNLRVCRWSEAIQQRAKMRIEGPVACSLIQYLSHILIEENLESLAIQHSVHLLDYLMAHITCSFGLGTSNYQKLSLMNGSMNIADKPKLACANTSVSSARLLLITPDNYTWKLKPNIQMQ